MPDVEIALLSPDAAAALAPLMASHVQEVRGGEPPRPDRYYAEKLLCDARVGLIGARIGGELIGFALFHEIADCVSGLEGGLLDTIFVRSDRRNHGAGRALLEALSAEGRRRAWSSLRWIVDDSLPHSTLPDHIAMPAAGRSLVVPITRQ